MTVTSYNAASVQQTMDTVNRELRSRGGCYSEYSCKTVSWDDVERGTVGGSLSCWGANITDTRLWEKSGKQLYTVRSDNWNEKLGKVSADDVALITGNQRGSPLAPITLRDFLKNMGKEGKYAGLDESTDLSSALDSEVSIRFQTTFLPVVDEQLAALEFAPEMYNYQTQSDDDPRNLLVLATTQGVAVQQDGAGAKRLYHHAVDPSTPGQTCRYWFEAERSSHKVGVAQSESKEEALAAAKRGKATAAVIGTRAMGTRFNVLLTVQVPLQQKPKPKLRGGIGVGGKGGPFYKCKKAGAMSFSCAPLLSCAPPSPDYQMALAEGSDDDFLSDSAELVMVETLNASVCLPRCRSVRSSPSPPQGKANAARVSRGTMIDRWSGLGVRNPKRDSMQRVTVTAVIYNTVAGGVPAPEDIAAAIDDMERLYAACGWTGKLTEAGAAFMKKELTVNDAAGITAKITQQPYTPPVGVMGLVVGGDAFPASAQ